MNLHTCTNDTKLKNFQFKFIHRIIYTNTMLFKMSKVDSPMCYFCSEKQETLLHMFIECDVVKKIWEKARQYVYRNINNNLKISKESICFGFDKSQREATCFIIIIKWYIFRCKIKEQYLNFNHLIHIYKNYKDTLHYLQKTE